MNHDPTAALVARLESREFEPKPTGRDSWESRCPAHGGDRRNLSIKRGDDGRVLIHCQAHSCPPAEIMGALGMTEADLFPPRADRHVKPRENGQARPKSKPESNGKRFYPTPEAAIEWTARKLGKPTRAWVYHEADGTETARVYRFDPPGERKEFRPAHYAHEGWAMGDPPGLWPPYHLPDLADSGRVYLTEGEKASDLARGLGVAATTSAHGAKSAHKTDWRPLAGKEVIILPDNDPEGEAYARSVLGELAKLDPTPSARIVRLADVWKTDREVIEGADIEEWLSDGIPEAWTDEDCRAELERVAEAAPLEDLNAPPPAEPEADPCEWEPLRLRSLPLAEPFPTHVFPEPLRQYCEETASVLLAPPDFIGAGMLAVGGAALGQSVNLRLKRTWNELPLLYLIAVARPGRMKTPAIRTVMKPLAEIDRELRVQSREDREAWEKAKKAHDRDPDNNPAPGPEPPQLRALVKDITRESLVIVLSDNPRGIMVDPDEASAWVASFNEYKAKGADRQFWLSIWSGISISVDRKGGRESPFVPFPFASVVGGLQPGLLDSLADVRGRDDGFTDRILFAYPGDEAFSLQRWHKNELSEETEAAWTDAIRRLHTLKMVTEDETQLQRPFFIGLTSEAEAVWAEWFEAHSAETEAIGFPDRQAGAWSKMKTHVARFALILCGLRWASDPFSEGERPGPVKAEDVRGAIALADYFKAHLARVIHEATGGSFGSGARDVLRWIERKALTSFGQSDLTRDLRRFRDDPEALDEALADLTKRHVIRRRPDPARPEGTRGRKPLPSFDVHPDLRAPENRGN